MSFAKEKLSNKHNIVIFTDLDGTLLDSGYSFKEAIPALKIIKKNNVPLILCSSKTESEIEFCRKKLKNDDPFISENGGGIFVPVKFKIQDSRLTTAKSGDHYMIRLGANYHDLRDILIDLRSEGFDLEGFGDMSVRRVSELTGLKMADAKRAKERDFDEPFIFNGDNDDLKELLKQIDDRGFNYTKGDFFHIMGDSDKGRAVDIVKGMYEKQRRKVKTIALGDSPNDIEMLQHVDYPVVVRKSNGNHHPEVVRAVKDCIKADGIGPEGWNRAVIGLLNKLLLSSNKH